MYLKFFVLYILTKLLVFHSKFNIESKITKLKTIKNEL